MALASEAREDSFDRRFKLRYPSRIEDELGLDAGRQSTRDAAIWKRNGESVRKGQIVSAREASLYEIDDVVHRALRLRERILVKRPALSTCLANPLAPIEHERTALDLDEQHAARGVQQ